MRMVIGLLLAASALLTLPTSPRLQGQHSLGVAHSTTVVVNSALQWFDVSPYVASPPPHWLETGYDDRRWSRGSQVPVNAYLCLSAKLHRSKDFSVYWGPDEWHNYLFRQTFVLPPAPAYQGSSVVSAVVGGGVLYLNNQEVDVLTPVGSTHDDIGKYLLPGKNVIAISARAEGRACSGLTFALTISAAPSSGDLPSPAEPPVNSVVPAPGAVITSSVIPFAWKSYAGAAAYYLTAWLTQPADGQQITPRSLVIMATRVVGLQYALPTQALPKGTYHWRLAAMGAQGELISAWTAEQDLTLR